MKHAKYAFTGLILLALIFTGVYFSVQDLGTTGIDRNNTGNSSTPDYTAVITNRTYNFTHYTVKIRTDYPSEGGIEPLIHTGEKRTITLRTGRLSQVIGACNELFEITETRHENICSELKNRLTGKR